MALQSLFEGEMQGSSSLNARGTTLAALVGASIALVANFTLSLVRGKDALTGSSGAWVIGAFLVAVIVLVAAAGLAVSAVLPRSKWRGELVELQRELAICNLAEPVQATQILFEMLDKQRVTNEKKAALMRWSYTLFAAGILLVMAEAAIGVVASR